MWEFQKLSILNDAINVCAIMKNNIVYKNSNLYHGLYCTSFHNVGWQYKNWKVKIWISVNNIYKYINF